MKNHRRIALGLSLTGLLAACSGMTPEPTPSIEGTWRVTASEVTFGSSEPETVDAGDHRVHIMNGRFVMTYDPPINRETNREEGTYVLKNGNKIEFTFTMSNGEPYTAFVIMSYDLTTPDTGRLWHTQPAIVDGEETTITVTRYLERISSN